MVSKLTILGLAAFAVSSAPALAQSLDVEGTWYTPNEKSAITIRDCGDGTPCGYVSFTKPDPGDPLVKDINNPDPELRDRPVLGMPLMWGFKPMSKKVGWKRGKIYDPTSGRTYGSGLSVTEDGQLKVKGCFGPICKTQIWKAAPSDLVIAAAQADTSD